MAQLIDVYLTRSHAEYHIDDLSFTGQGEGGYQSYIQRRSRELSLYNYPHPVIFEHRRIDPEMIDWLNIKNDLLFRKIDTFDYVDHKIVSPAEFNNTPKVNKFQPEFNFDGRYILINNSQEYSLDFLKDYDYIPSFGSNWKRLEADMNKEVPIYLENRLVFTLNDYSRAHFFDKTLYKPIPVSEFRAHKQKQEAIDFWRIADGYVKDIPANRLTWSIVSALAKAAPDLLKHLPPEKVPGEVLDAAVKIDGSILIDYPDKNALTIERVVDAINSKTHGSGILLQHLPDEEKTRPLCFTAVSSDGNALEFVPEKLRDEEICRKALDKAREVYGGHLELLSIIPHPELWLREYTTHAELVDKVRQPAGMETFNIYNVYREIEKKMVDDGADPLPYNLMKEAWEKGGLEIKDDDAGYCFNILINREEKTLTINTAHPRYERNIEDIDLEPQSQNTKTPTL